MLNEGENLKLKTYWSKKKVSEETKKDLAKQIHKYPPLWDVNDEQYMKRGATNSCWEKVSQVIKMPVDDCKTVWKGLRDAIHYRTRTKPRKSGDGSLEDGLSRQEFQTWALRESLSFLIDNMIKKATTSTTGSFATSSPTSNNEEDGNSKDFQPQYQVIEIINDSEQDDSMIWSKMTEVKTTSCKRKPRNYDYAKSKRRTEGANCAESNVAVPIPERVEIREVDAPARGLKYDSMYANLDRMLKKLPESVVEDLNVQFINLTYAEVKKYGNLFNNAVCESDRTLK